MAYSTSALHLTNSNSTPSFSYRRQVRTKGFNSDDDLRRQSLEVELPHNGTTSLGASDPIEGRLENFRSDNLASSPDIGAGPKENCPNRSSSALLAGSKSDPMISRRSPGSYSTLQRQRESQHLSRTRSSSPGSEMVTLEEFLQESGQSPNNVSIRNDLLSDYFRKKSEPSMISEHPNRKEMAKMPTSYVSPIPKNISDSTDGKGPKPGQYVRPNPRPTVTPAQSGSSLASPQFTVSSNIPKVSKPREKAAQPQQQPLGNTRSSSLTRAFSLASADLLRHSGPDRQETQHKLAMETSSLSRDSGKSGWKSTGDCRSAGSQHERPQSARVLSSNPTVSISCRTLDPRRLSLAPPKDGKCLSVSQHSLSSLRNCGGPSSSPGSPSTQPDKLTAPGSHHSQPASCCGEVPLLCPGRSASQPSDEQPTRAHRPCEEASSQSRFPEYSNATSGTEEPSKRNSSGGKDSGGSKGTEASADQQTVWYEYGCV